MHFSFLTLRSERFRADRWHFARGKRAVDGILKVTESLLCARQGIKCKPCLGTFFKGCLRTVPQKELAPRVGFEPRLLTAEVVENPKCFIVCSLQRNTTDSQSLEWGSWATKGGIPVVLGC